MPYRYKYKSVRLLLAYSCLCLLALPAAAKEWRVVPGESIAKAIQSATSGDTVKVERGYYHEHIVIDKALALIGTNRPTISGDNQPGDVIRINALTCAWKVSSCVTAEEI